MTLTLNPRSRELALPSPEVSPPQDKPDRTILIGICVAIAFFGGFFVWAALATISSAAVAPGYVTVEGSRKAVQHRDGGPVGAVLVKDGDLVQEGQTLIRLDLSDVRAEVEVLSAMRLQLLARLARLRAEAAEAELAFPQELLQAAANDPKFRPILDQERDLFDTRRIAYQGNIRLLNQQIEGYRRQIIGLRGQVQSKHNQLVSIDKEHNDLAGLLEKGYVQRPRVLALEREGQSLRGDLEGLHASIATAQNEINKAELQIAQAEKDRREEIATGLSDAETNLAQIEPKLVSARDRLSRAELVAPVSGYVYNLAVHSPGAAITPGQIVLEIVPVSEGLVITAEVSTTDIERVYPGQPVEVHLLPYRQRWQAIMDGSVVRISPDRFEDPAKTRSWFNVIVSVNPESLKRNEAVMVPGMPAQAVIQTGERTVLDFLLDPVFRVYDFAMKED